jgi:hypothetical protein
MDHYFARAEAAEARVAELEAALARAEARDEVGSADSSAAGVDGASEVLTGAAPGHHEPVGERQGRQTALPTQLLVDGAGFVWRDFGEEYLSGCPFNPDNEPLPDPITVYVPSYRFNLRGDDDARAEARDA